MTTNRPLNDAERVAVLEWYRAAGVDLAVGEAPVDRFAQAAQLPAPAARRIPAIAPAAPSARPSEPPLPLPGEADAQTAMALAAQCHDLADLRVALEAYDGCGLKRRATQLVFADGNPEADIMLIGEAPGRDEDLQGKPFVGRSGQLLDRMLGAIGLDRTRVYIANIVPWRPPGNRTPTPAEAAACLPFLHRQIELVAPRIVVALGAASAGHLFDTDQGINRIRGQWRDIAVGDLSIRAVATLHPAYLLRQPAQKRMAWQDMLAIKAALRAL